MQLVWHASASSGTWVKWSESVLCIFLDIYTSFIIMFHWNSFHLLASNFFVVISVEFLLFVSGCAKILLVHLLIDVKFSSNTLLGQFRNMTLLWLKRTYDEVKVPQYVIVVSIILTFPRFSVWREMQVRSFILTTKRLSCVLS